MIEILLDVAPFDLVKKKMELVSSTTADEILINLNTVEFVSM